MEAFISVPVVQKQVEDSNDSETFCHAIAKNNNCSKIPPQAISHNHLTENGSSQLYESWKSYLSGGSDDKKETETVPSSYRGPNEFTGGSGGSDIERFDGKIVYNPDGSAYIIEDSENSEEEGGSCLEVPQLEGCIVEGRGVRNTSSIPFPQIASAFYVSRGSGTLYNGFYGEGFSSLVDSKAKIPDIPIMHSYRVYTVRDNRSKNSNKGGKAEEENISSKKTECSSVPIKPILMCFICKLSFGYTKSFVAHALGDHSLTLSEEEMDIFSTRNVSAIIQCVGKAKEPLISFLEPMGNSIGRVPLMQNSIITHNTVPNYNNRNKIEITNNNSDPISTSPPISPLSKTDSEDKSNNVLGMDLSRRSPVSVRSSVSPGNSLSPIPNISPSLPNNNSNGHHNNNSSIGPPNFMTGTTIGVCPEHMNGRPSGVDCSKCELILNSSRMGALGSLHTRNSCKTLKCPKCNWHYKYQETLEIHMKEKHPDNETSCIYCIAGQPHPRLARGETYTCGYKPYRCEVCNYSTTTKGNLSIHMQSDKHLNNMQELQNGGVVPQENPPQLPPPATPPTQLCAKSSQQTPSSCASSTPVNGPSGGCSTSGVSASPKPKPSFRCDVCNYETNVARNLRIHMTSEKHTHNMMVLQQNVKHMQHLSNLQASGPFDQAAALLQFHSSLSGGGGGNTVENKTPHTEAALADMAYNQALLIQMMTGGQMPPHIPPELAPHMDLGLNPDTMEPPPEPPDPNPSEIYTCCVCTTFTSDSVEALSHHLTLDRTKLREQEILVLVAGNFMCKLCSYKTNLKANFQLHCKTDKHLQRLQHVNHIKEGGIRNEWKLKYLSMSNPIQVRCNACDYYTNSAHKLQLHAAHQRHEISVLIFRQLLSQEILVEEEVRIYVCALCGYTTRVKLQLLQHTRSLKHLQLEQLHNLQRRAEGNDGLQDINQIFRVLEQPRSSDSPIPPQHLLSIKFHEEHDGKDVTDFKKSEISTAVTHLKNAQEGEINDLNCPYCSYVTDSDSRLQSHIFSQHSGTDFSNSTDSRAAEIVLSCPLCQEPCSDKKTLEHHVMQTHSVNSEGLQRLLILLNQSHLLSSSSSDLKLDSNDEIEQENYHEDSQSEIEEFRCTACSKSYHSVDDLYIHQNEQGHLEIKQTPSGPGYLCWKKGCNQYFPTASALQMHFKEIHVSRSGKNNMAVSEKHVYKYRCNQCSLAFKTMEKLSLHSQYHAIRDASKCCLCGRSFRSLLALQKHVETSHTELSDEELLQFKQSISSNPLLLAGLSGQVLEPGMTELLKKESAKDEDIYMDIYENEENLSEGEADSNDSIGTKDQQQLFEDYLNTQAMAEDSYNDPNRKYKCHRCKVAFTRQSYLTSHNKTLLHRKGEKLSYPMEKYLDPNRPYKCEVCKESFTQKNILLVHYNSVSHLHKLKRAMQEQSIFSHGSINAPSQSPSPKNSINSQNINLSTPTTPTDEDDKKPFKCNICKVAYSQGSTLDIHMRSVLHQTRASKLQELALSGQIDLSKPLIEQPEVQRKSSMSNISPKSNLAQLEVLFSERDTSPGNFSCSKCKAILSSPEQLAQHESLFCLYTLNSLSTNPPDSLNQSLNTTLENSLKQDWSTSPNESYQRFTMPGKKSSQLYKHILESYGFEIVMQFNEYHQKRRKEVDNEDENNKELIEEKLFKEFPELAKSNCPYCKKTFSTVWILKAHCEEIHKDVVSMESLENYAENFRLEYIKKCKNIDKECLKEKEEEIENLSKELNICHQSSNTPAASVTPASSSDSHSASGTTQSLSNSTNPNISLSLAHQMNEVQAALMAASQLQHFNPMINPMMMASLGMGLPLGLNMNALAAMNLQPPLVPMMMHPPFDHHQNQGSNSFSSEAQKQPSAPTTPTTPQLQTSSSLNNSNNQQKRARTRITDDQLKILRAHFDINNSPSEEQISQMAASSGLPPKVIKHWFRNTLFKERQRNKDSPYNFSNPPSTTLNLEEYEKTGEAQVKNIDVEEQKLYELSTPPLSQIVKKENNIPSLVKKQSTTHQKIEHQIEQEQQHQLQHHQLLTAHLQALQQQHNEHMQQFNFNHQNEFDLTVSNAATNEYSETESKSEDEPPKKKNKGVSSKIKTKKNSLSRSFNESQSQDSHHINVNTLMLNSNIDHSSSSSPTPQQMLPPSKNNSFLTPTNVSCGSLSGLINPLPSPLNLNSPGSSCGRGENPSMTTPPLSQGSMSSGKRANRTRFTDYQIKVLQEFFENNAYPKDDDLEYLSKLLGLSPRVIVVWFQNARQKARKVYENQPPVDTPDEGAGRFQRTPGLNYQCKKCLLVFQRYYELIRHQKTHCFKEEDAKRSAQAQAAAAQVAAAMTDDESNCSEITDNHSISSSCGPSPRDMGPLLNCNQTRETSTTLINFQNEIKNQKTHQNNLMLADSNLEQNSAVETFQCEKCSLIFPRFDLWREHQLVHLMNPNLFASFSSESPFGMLQQHAQSTNSIQNPHTNQQIKIEPKESNQTPSESSSIAGDGKRKWSADEHTEDDEIIDGQPRDKRLRTTILPEQLDYLYQKYQIESNPSRKMLETIAREVGLKKRVVQVWFQNTRARERKGQFRAHAQVINKRCPFCPALFKVKSALETHLAAKHADQYSKGEINIDAIPDEEFDINESILGESNSNKLAFVSSSSVIAPFLNSLSAKNDIESSLSKLYEDSIKRYTQQVQAIGAPSGDRQKAGGEFPLDLSKPINLSRSISKAEDSMDTHDYLSDGEYFEASRDSFDSSSEEIKLVEDKILVSHSNTKNISESSEISDTKNSGNKRFRTQMSSLQVKVMKSLFTDYKTPTMADCEKLAIKLGLPRRVVQVWFQNARAKEKKNTLSLSLKSNNELDIQKPSSFLCLTCNFIYSSTFLMQDHIFTSAHIDKLMELEQKRQKKIPKIKNEKKKVGKKFNLLNFLTTSDNQITSQPSSNDRPPEKSLSHKIPTQAAPCMDILESLNIFPVVRNVDENKEKPISAGISSEMDNIVQKIAELSKGKESAHLVSPNSISTR